ncbi:MAG: flagellar protein FlaG [Oceanospirillales bacterium]|uniref:Flagellar protein FlaG n=1 Tax=Marinobacterium halophilum TaxID=267374 RepID=A0A2P8ESD2_9GAMM|nr:flagellar protein FlaG [Marinobacterium halophilum]MBR9827680.1 flagellar protein FlaG [Oceanospirillales bacterium]PSL12345.1 flagellar protein FlaG [Marinobacterium halophilum]
MSIETSGLSNQQAFASQTTSSRQQPESSSAANAAPVATVNSVTDSVQQINSSEGAALSIEKLQDAVEKMNEMMQNGNRSLSFSVDDSTEKVVVKVMDLDTDEVVRQIPTEETLKFAEYLEGVVGLIFDETV